MAGGAAAMTRLLDRDEPFDALFSGSDQMAFGALSVLRERGIRVPEDLAIVGFDDDDFATNSHPQLTTVSQPSVALGERMAEVLVSLIEGEPIDKLTIMPTTVVRRASA